MTTVDEPQVSLGGGLPVAAQEVDTCSHIVVCGATPVVDEDEDGGEGAAAEDRIDSRLLRGLLSSLKAMGVGSAAFAGLHGALLAGRLFIVTPR